MKRVPFLFACLLLMALSACAAKPSALIYTKEMNSKTVEIQSGATFYITLEGNPTTGFTWEVQDMDSTVVKQVGEVEFKADTDAIGSGGMQTLTFTAVAPGATTLKLIYHRPFEKDVPPAETFNLIVTVK
jgi:inhibitor of cysteine peptidase